MRNLIHFFKKNFFKLFILLSLCFFIWSTAIEPRFLKVHHETFEWPYESLTIGFISDLHAGSPYINLEYLDHLVQTMNLQKPDLILMGGDFAINEVLGGKPIEFSEVTKRLKKMNPPLGLYTVLGNHDWWNNGEKHAKTLRENGINVLENESIFLTYHSESIQIIGIGDAMTNHDDLKKAFPFSNAHDSHSIPKVLFMHDPAALLKLEPEQTFQLALAGHMHGGQIHFPFIGALYIPGKAPKSWSKGWVHLKNGPLFVTSGIGTSTLPVRFNAPPEIVLFHLLKKESSSKTH